MTPQLKYVLLALFIFLDVCIVVYFFTGTFSPSVKPAVQQTVSPPPVPAPVPPVNTQALADCNVKAAQYQKKFASDWPKSFGETRSDTPEGDRMFTHRLEEYKIDRLQWGNVVTSCESVVGWVNPVSRDTVELAMKHQCDAYASRAYQILIYWPEIGKQKGIAPEQLGNWLEQDITNLHSIEMRCQGLVTGWRLRFDKESLIRQARTKQSEIRTYDNSPLQMNRR